MRIFVVAFAILAVAASAAIDSPFNEYLPPSEDIVTVHSTNTDDSAVLTDDGYRYKTLRRLKYRHRRDISEIANEYLPAVEEASTEAVAELKSVEEPEESAVLGDNGYEYKTVRRLKYRRRRDVSEIANEYLPPVEEASTEAVAEAKSADEPEESGVLGDNGYEYKTVRRLKYRRRRDVSEIANEYLPPVEEVSTEAVAEVKSAEEPEESAVLGDNGYEYKTVRRLKYRHRRDVSEIANEYLPPVEEASTEAVAELKSFEEPEQSAVLGDNGYEYKTVRRLKYRHRRDVSEIANEYLPPVEEASTEAVAEVKSADEPEESAVLGDNGYEYKVVRRLKYRHRRDVSEIANEYLPPVEEASTEAVAEVKSADEPEESAVLGDNGYEYKTVRRLKYRHRRDVSEIANEYLPPVEEASTEAVAELKSVEEPEESAVLGDNGYEYKTVRRLKYRHRRDVSEIANEYLPPVEEASTEAVAELKSVEEPEESAVLGDNGYEYKTVRRLKYRHRRDVSEIANEYLPPVEEASTEAVAELKSVEEPEESAVLGDNGYEYKTVRRLKYRHRRDVPEIANEYLPPVEEASTEAVAEVKSADEPEESAVLGDNGYEYKTVRRLKYRHRRDVSEIANEYLPPVEEASTEAVAELKSVEEPEESAVLGDNGYEYKTVRRLKYRHRRDVSEIANEYLPPVEEVSTEAVAEVKSAEEPEESAVLGDNGYEYKTVRRLKYRRRRDVSEISNEYLPPVEEVSTEAVAELKSAEEPEESAVLGDNGYEYKTVRRLKYRHRRDVSEIANEYLPPVEEVSTEAVAEVKSAEEPEESAVLGDNGYEYKTVRRLKYRRRRDVSEIANEYLPPVEEASTEAVAEAKSADAPEESGVLGDNGYEYKTVRRLKYRHRRDVSEIANEYLPPVEEASTEAVAELKSVEEPEESAVLGDNGYEYKTVRRLKYRHRRDVSEIANEYLPPVEEVSTEAVAEVKSADEPEESAVLGDNGYEYKTVRRLKYRHRRDVSEIANEYLPPVEEASTEAVAELKSFEEPEESAVLGDNGYEYKTVRHLKYRHRRDVPEIANEYLPPVEEASTEAVAEVKSADEPEESAVLGDNGYEYKTVRRLKYRHRRDVSEIANEYLPPVEEASTEAVAELKSVEEPEESAVLGDNGYEYKTVRRLKYRHRRDVPEIANEYLPPVEEVSTEAVAEVKSADEPEESAVLGDNGYEYKTVRRLKYRHRRDVSEIANEYLPPVEEASTEAVAELKSFEEPEESAVLGDNGYEYKTVRRLKYRHRRDVSEIANEYLPPVEEASTEAVAEVKSADEPEESAVLGDNGYEYKTVRRLKYRHRRDVSEIANEYLPPVEEASTEAVAELKSVEEPEESAVLGDNGYEYKTVRRLKYRHRRDVPEIANEYLPPVEEVSTEAVAEVKSADEPEESAVLGDNGYEYKTVRRLKYRHRRDVSEIANEYLPPVEEASTEAVAELKSFEEPEESAVLGDNGYKYKTVRRLKYRHRRDVSEIANEYLPPVEEASTEAVAEVKSADEPEESAVLGDNGYEYKTVRRLKYRHRRDVSEIANEYLPPVEEASTEAVAELKSVEEPEESAVLGDNGYEYKTVRRLKYRHRRDVPEIANEYLPPVEEASTEAVAEVKSADEPEESAVLGDNGYEYKTVRRLKYRHRRDVSEIANEYLPPVEEASTEAVAELKSVEEPEESAVLGDNGYEYKTVRHLKYRHRRDVPEIANEYLPPVEEASTEAVAEVKSADEPEESAVLGDNGYEYKTVRRLKYRHRRDVSEIANEYLPPVEEASTEAVAELKSFEEPEESAVLGDNGYEYKTVRRLKYRHRRDVSEIANEYLPPVEEASTEAVADVKSLEEPEESAILGDNGYEYRTVRRLKYRVH